MSELPARAKYEILREALGTWRDAHPDTDLAERYLQLYYRHVSSEELSELSAAQICGPADTHLELGKDRVPGRAKIRVFSPSTGEWGTEDTVVEIVTDDAPFLVNSVTSELTRFGLGVRRVLHPQLEVDRELTGELRDVEPRDPDLKPVPESWMHITVDRQSDPAGNDALLAGLERVLGDVRNVDEDADKLRRRAATLAEELSADLGSMLAAGIKEQEVRESAEFLRWLGERNFIFMGYREYNLVTTEGNVPEDGDHTALALSAAPGSGLGLLRQDAHRSQSFAALPPEAQERARDPRVLVLTKANSRSTVNQPKYLDYIGVKKFDEAGRVIGERRFLGLYTHEAESTSVSMIPILGRKLAEVLDIAGLSADSYDGRDVIEVVDLFPREELFQISVRDLHDAVHGVLRLRGQRGTRLFMRRDDYGRYVTCLVYMPRDRYTTRVRMDIQEVLLDTFEGATIDHSVMVTSAPLAMLYLVVRANRDQGHSLAEVDQADLERQVAAASRSWDDDLFEKLGERFGADRAGALARRFTPALPESYKIDVTPDMAVDDIARLDTLGSDTLQVKLYESGDSWRLKVYRAGAHLSLSRLLPLLEHMGAEIVEELPYEVASPTVASDRFWIYDFGLGDLPGADVSRSTLRSLFEDAFVALWDGDTESDMFNTLVMRAGLTWREVGILRAYARFLRQAGTTFSQDYIAEVLAANRHLAAVLVRLFESRFTPSDLSAEERAERTDAIAEEAHGVLDQVASLDHDRILRALLETIQATVRTNYFQPDAAGRPKPYVVLKLDPQRIPDLPAPRPRFEMYVYSPRFEGVHLRFGSVARGGLRWSDRQEDFRTEILGLVKAQMVKNAVIVPSGAKGGFVCKRLPAGGDRDAVQTEVVACYTQFISGLLDVTDNRVDGEILHPQDVVRYDEEDSYLVVAADKGTATFSDIANGVAAERDFWLGDAFASGGSVGYDHKGMGITARGAWESVKYHGLEMGVDVQRQDFTAVGVGDMSGDVFGNGMLLSRHIRLIAAFDHRHVFIDPDPDVESSYAERERLFHLPRSSWADYDQSLISAGGGIHPRTAKSIPITPQVREALDIPDVDGAPVTALPPQELIKAVLRAPVDLLWNGGIGTYVKATAESHASVGDKSTDSVRVDGAELRCRIVGEGGNLGLTQLGRIEFALGGGRVNTDFIDNSAGVNTSDHEVNIKIMLDREVRAGRLTKKERDQLFRDQTETVAQLVLADNDQQNVALAASRQQASSMLHVHARYIRELERSGQVKRRLEFLPDDRVIAERRSMGTGLTSPEFAVLIAHTKIQLEEEILASDLPADPYLRRTLRDYFPEALRERYGQAMETHPLEREIITTSVVNDLVNRMGSTLAFRVNEETGVPKSDIARAYLIVRDVFDLPLFWNDVEELRGRVGIDTQLTMMLEARKLAERASRWLLSNRTAPLALTEEIDSFRSAAQEIVPQLPDLLQGRDLAAFEERRRSLENRDVPRELAERVAGLVPAYSTLSLVAVAGSTHRPMRSVARVYFYLADQLQISRLRERIIGLPRDDRWNTMARTSVRDDLYAAHADLTESVLASGAADSEPEQLLANWSSQNAHRLAQASSVLSDIWETERFDLATLSVAVRAVRELV